MHRIRELVGELPVELAERPRSASAVAVALLVLVLAGGVASIAGSELAVASIAAVGMLGAGVTVLVLTARSARHR